MIGRGSCRLRSDRAFTLVELIVALGIVVLLAGLAVTAFSTVAESADRARTEATLTALDGAIEAWEGASGRLLRRQPDADLEPETPFVFVISEVLRAVERAPATAEWLEAIETDRLVRYQPDVVPPWIRTYSEEAALESFHGTLTVLDAWGVPIYATHPGEVATAGTPLVDADGTERTPNEIAFGIARNRRICFISAGPDRRFGLVYEFPGLSGSALAEAIDRARADNVASYPPVFPQ